MPTVLETNRIPLRRGTRTPYWRSRCYLTCVVMLLLSAGCIGTERQSPTEPNASLAPTPGKSTPVESVIVRRTLDFEAAKHRGRLLAIFRYGSQHSQLGAVPTCQHAGCERPCPCTLPVGPSAFDVDERGRYWFLDMAKGRIAVFNRLASYEFAVKPEGNNYRNGDLQSLDDQILVTRQGGAVPRLIRIRERAVVSSSLVVTDYGRYMGGDYISVTPEGQAFTFLMEKVDLSTECCFGTVELPLIDGPKARATPVPGVGYGDDGWLFEDLDREEEIGNGRVISYRVEGNDPWAVDIRLVLAQKRHGVTKQVSGSVSWEIEIGPDGTLHLLIFAGAEGNRFRESGYWYLSIDPHGSVGEPIPLAAPKARKRLFYPLYQRRRLSLDSYGNPLVMWAAPNAARIFSLMDFAEST